SAFTLVEPRAPVSLLNVPAIVMIGEAERIAAILVDAQTPGGTDHSVRELHRADRRERGGGREATALWRRDRHAHHRLDVSAALHLVGTEVPVSVTREDPDLNARSRVQRQHLGCFLR